MTTGLRLVENQIEKWRYNPKFIEAGWAGVFINAPKLLKMGIVNPVVNSSLRITTAALTAIYDLAYGIIFHDGNHLKDGLHAIPKAIVHLVIDSLIFTGSIAASVIAITALAILLLARLAEKMVEGIVSCLRPIGSRLDRLYSE